MTHDIWLVIGRLCVGGAEKTLIDLANGLDHDRYSVTVCTFSEPNPLADELDSRVDHRTFGSYTKFNPVSHIQFLRSVARERPAVVQSFLPVDNTLCRALYILFPDIAVITGLRSVPNDPNVVFDTLDRVTLSLSDCIVSNSKAGKRYLLERGCDPEDVKVVYNGRNIDAYYDASASVEILAEYGISEDNVTVGTVGRLIERKGQYDLLAAWPTVKDKVPAAELLLVGDGPERDRLQHRAAELDCQESVHFLGTRNDVPTLLALMDAFVFPSHFEGLPGALLEAMAAELPIVCTPVDGNSELVIDGESGLYVAPQCPDQLSRQLIEMITDDEFAQQLAENAHQRARTEFSLDAMVEGFSSLYREYAGDSGLSL